MCGIIGVVGQTGTHVNQLIYDGLTVLQHRGQDAAGIVTEIEGRFHLRKKTGLVKDVFREAHETTAWPCRYWSCSISNCW